MPRPVYRTTLLALTALALPAWSVALWGQAPAAPPVAQPPASIATPSVAQPAPIVQGQPAAQGPSAAGVQPAPPADLLRRNHRWATFQQGAWKQVRVVTETLNEQGEVVDTSTTESTTVLDNVTDSGVQLLVDMTLEVAGKKFEAEPQIVAEPFHGATQGARTVLRPVGQSELVLQGRRVACQLYELLAQGPDQVVTTRLYYAPQVPPYVLKRVSVVTDPSGRTTLHETVQEVVAVERPLQVLAQTVSAAQVRTVRTNAKGTTTTVAYHAPGVPGGVVTYTAQERDPLGRTIRRSRLELIDYGVEPSRRLPRRPLLNRRIRRRMGG